MNLKDLAAWLESMNEVTSGCVLELRAADRGGITLAMSWRNNGREQWYQPDMSGINVLNMNDAMQVSVLEQISHCVVDSMRNRQTLG
jgi:hypothetical protein